MLSSQISLVSISIFLLIHHHVESSGNLGLLKSIHKEHIDQDIYNRALQVAIENFNARQKCRLDQCMRKFKSVGICSGSGAFYLWAKQLASKMEFSNPNCPL